ncbi:uncharacterized protein LOC114357815 [Ostrinia furnacalis]|uniref:uncharacterized protein LOC114357815 n=1 Tax=Ostrinia furnacalis TaxID=93504 RepID=UPI001038CB57|nr:uncharacterized protein LOC114357815 [Ostrinia furnacalis]
MPRYFYLLCLLLAMNGAFCYDYISDRNSQNNHGRRLSKKFRNQKAGDKRFVHKNRPEYEMAEEKEPLAQIDVASFIQKPDEYSIDENFPYELENKGRNPKLKHENDYGSLLGYNSEGYIMKNTNRGPYYLNSNSDSSFDLGPNPLRIKDPFNSRHSNLDSMSLYGLGNEKFAKDSENKAYSNNYKNDLYETNSNLIHNPEKKCIRKYMKFPFFSHNKTATTKPKKEKKRKVFCFNCSKKEKSKDQSNDPKETGKEYNLETLNKISMNDPSDNLENLKTKSTRGKRDELSDASDRERQLKELDEIQRKVDNLEITSSSYQKAP